MYPFRHGVRGENEKSGSETRNDSRGALMRAHDYNKTARRVVHRAAAPAFSPFQRLPLVPRNGIPATVRRDGFAERIFLSISLFHFT